jgi:hypothetical protein
LKNSYKIKFCPSFRKAVALSSELQDRYTEEHRCANYPDFIQEMSINITSNRFVDIRPNKMNNCGCYDMLQRMQAIEIKEMARLNPDNDVCQNALKLFNEGMIY